MGFLFRLVLFVVAGMVAFAVVMVTASESGEVVILRSAVPEGPLQETRLWVIDDGLVVWLRAGDPASGWCERIRANPEVELTRDEETAPYVATPMDGDPELRDWINHRMAEKYGWADWVVGLVADRSAAVPIRLDAR